MAGGGLHPYSCVQQNVDLLGGGGDQDRAAAGEPLDGSGGFEVVGAFGGHHDVLRAATQRRDPLSPQPRWIEIVKGARLANKAIEAQGDEGVSGSHCGRGAYRWMR